MKYFYRGTRCTTKCHHFSLRLKTMIEFHPRTRASHHSEGQVRRLVSVYREFEFCSRNRVPNIFQHVAKKYTGVGGIK